MRCLVPYTLKTGEHVPCGKCPDCVARRVSGWSFRLMMEERFCSSAHFITLTYAPENVSHLQMGGRLSLSKRDVQLFIKNLRRYSTWPRSIKYFAVGEYGTNFSRPHYHVLLFNVSSELVQRAWQHGQVYYGTVSAASVGYCLKYMCKERKVPQYKGDLRRPEFGLFSKGLGLAYLTPEVKAWHLDDLCGRMYIPLEGGLKIAMPRYFKDRIYTKPQRMRIQLDMAVRELGEFQKTYRSSSASVRLDSFIKLRAGMESFNSRVRKQRVEYFSSRSSIF